MYRERDGGNNDDDDVKNQIKSLNMKIALNYLRGVFALGCFICAVLETELNKAFQSEMHYTRVAAQKASLNHFQFNS